MKHPRRRLRTAEAARYVGLSPRTLEALRLRGSGPSFAKLGRAVVYDTEDLDLWLSEHRRPGSDNASRVNGERS
jgi:predicted DNA-binding transcriptional regulator AlpA